MCAPRHWLTHGLGSLAWTIQIEFQSVFRQRQQCHKGYALFMQLKTSAPFLPRCKIGLNSWNKITQSPEQSVSIKVIPLEKMASVHPILHPQICLHRSSAGHFYLNEQNLWWWTFWDMETWVDWLHTWLPCPHWGAGTWRTRHLIILISLPSQQCCAWLKSAPVTV